MEDIHAQYGKSHDVLTGVSLRCSAGESLCLMGENGAGKTTLMAIAAGLRKPHQGTVSRNGPWAFVPQDNGVLPDLTVTDNLRLWYAAWQRSGERLYRPESPEKQLGLASYGKKRVAHLSGGLQKRLALACALAGEPKLLLLDEPFAGLDVPTCALSIRLLQGFCAKGGALLFSSHAPWCIAQLAQSVLLLQQGRIVCRQSLALQGEQTLQKLLERLSQQTYQ